MHIATPFCKFAHGVEHVHRIPFYVEMAVRHSIYGRPGACYLDMPDDIIQGEVEEEKVKFPARCAEPPRMTAPDENIQQALNALESRRTPVWSLSGKGMAWSHAEEEVRDFIERTQVPVPRFADGQGCARRHAPAVGWRRTQPRFERS